MHNDPLDSQNYIRVTGKNRGIDGRGRRFYIEQREDVEVHPFFLLLLTPVFIFLLVLLTGCTDNPQPQFIEAKASLMAQQQTS
jgi:hypothetical protein